MGIPGHFECCCSVVQLWGLFLKLIQVQLQCSTSQFEKPHAVASLLSVAVVLVLVAVLGSHLYTLLGTLTVSCSCALLLHFASSHFTIY